MATVLHHFDLKLSNSTALTVSVITILLNTASSLFYHVKRNASQLLGAKFHLKSENQQVFMCSILVAATGTPIPRTHSNLMSNLEAGF